MKWQSVVISYQPFSDHWFAKFAEFGHFFFPRNWQLNVRARATVAHSSLTSATCQTKRRSCPCFRPSRRCTKAWMYASTMLDWHTQSHCSAEKQRAGGTWSMWVDLRHTDKKCSGQIRNGMGKGLRVWILSWNLWVTVVCGYTSVYFISHIYTKGHWMLSICLNGTISQSPSPPPKKLFEQRNIPITQSFNP